MRKRLLLTDGSYQLMEDINWRKLSTGEVINLLIKVRIAIEVKRSDDWWRFACGDVLYTCKETSARGKWYRNLCSYVHVYVFFKVVSVVVFVTILGLLSAIRILFACSFVFHLHKLVFVFVQAMAPPYRLATVGLQVFVNAPCISIAHQPTNPPRHKLYMIKCQIF